MILSRQVGRRLRRLQVERLEQRQMLSANGFTSKFDSHSVLFDEGAFRHSDTVETRSSLGQHEQSRRQHRTCDAIHGAASERFAIESRNRRAAVFGSSLSNALRTTTVVTQSTRSFSAIIEFQSFVVETPFSQLVTPSGSSSGELVSLSDATEALSTGTSLQQNTFHSAAPIAAEPEFAEHNDVDAAESADRKVVPAPASESRETLVSTRPQTNTETLPESFQGNVWWTPQGHDSALMTVTPIDATEIGQWMNRIDYLEQKYSDLEHSLDKLARQRQESPEAMPDSTAGVPIPSGWLEQVDSIMLINDSQNDSTDFVVDDKPTSTVADGWTVGIGIHQTIDMAQSHDLPVALLDMIQQPMETGMNYVDLQHADTNQTKDELWVQSNGQILSVAICVAGIQYLRSRNKRTDSFTHDDRTMIDA